MKRVRRVVTVTYEYDSAEELDRHCRIMEADGWETADSGESSDCFFADYTLELAEDDAL